MMVPSGTIKYLNCRSGTIDGTGGGPSDGTGGGPYLRRTKKILRIDMVPYGTIKYFSE